MSDKKISQLNNYETSVNADIIVIVDLETGETKKQTKQNFLKEIVTSISDVVTSITNHINNIDNPHEVTKSQIGLGNVDNTSDIDKPISTATQSALDDKADLDEDGKVPASQLPALAITDVFVVSSEAEQIALEAQKGDVAVRTDENKSYIHNGGTSGTISDWTLLNTPTDLVLSVNGQTGTVVIGIADIANLQTILDSKLETRVGVWRPLDLPAGSWHPSTTAGATYEVKEFGTVNYPCFEMTKTSPVYIENEWTIPRYMLENDDNSAFVVECFTDNATNNSRTAVFDLQYLILDVGEALTGSWANLGQVQVSLKQNSQSRSSFSINEISDAISIQGKRVKFRIHRSGGVSDNATDADVYFTGLYMEYLEETTEPTIPS